MAESTPSREAAARQFDRIVRLVAHSSRNASKDSEGGTPLDRLASEFETSPSQIAQDLRTLTSLGEDAESDWLLSLTVIQEGDRVLLQSRGAFRRPARLTPDELLAVRIALATEPGGQELAHRLGEHPGGGNGENSGEVSSSKVGRVIPVGSDLPSDLRILELLHQAVGDRRVVSLDYLGLESGHSNSRDVEPHQCIAANGAYYCIAWCRTAGGWRNFRLDRILEANAGEEGFEPRSDFTPAMASDDAFLPSPDPGIEARVRFSPAIARWILERHPECEREDDGSVTRSYQVLGVEWFVRHILGYGTEAEILEPEEFRELLRSRLSQSVPGEATSPDPGVGRAT